MNTPFVYVAAKPDAVVGSEFNVYDSSTLLQRRQTAQGQERPSLGVCFVSGLLDRKEVRSAHQPRRRGGRQMDRAGTHENNRLEEGEVSREDGEGEGWGGWSRSWGTKGKREGGVEGVKRPRRGKTEEVERRRNGNGRADIIVVEKSCRK